MEEKGYSQVKVLGGVVDADDEGEEEEEHASRDPSASSGEPELDEDCSTTGLSLPREKNWCQSLETHSQQDCPPEYLMKEGDVHRVKIFMADSPSNMVGRPLHLEKEYQKLLDNLSSLFSLRSHGTCWPNAGG